MPQGWSALSRIQNGRGAHGKAVLHLGIPVVVLLRIGFCTNSTS